MALPLDVDPSMDELDQPMNDADLVFDYDELFDEEDFRAIGIDPVEPTPAKPGSDEKVMMLAARYASGLPLWHDSDCYDHGPGGLAMIASEFASAN